MQMQTQKLQIQLQNQQTMSKKNFPHKQALLEIMDTWFFFNSLNACNLRLSYYKLSTKCKLRTPPCSNPCKKMSI